MRTAVIISLVIVILCMCVFWACVKVPDNEKEIIEKACFDLGIDTCEAENLVFIKDNVYVLVLKDGRMFSVGVETTKNGELFVDVVCEI